MSTLQTYNQWNDRNKNYKNARNMNEYETHIYKNVFVKIIYKG